jgi:hypothetical protein
VNCILRPKIWSSNRSFWWVVPDLRWLWSTWRCPATAQGRKAVLIGASSYGSRVLSLKYDMDAYTRATPQNTSSSSQKSTSPPYPPRIQGWDLGWLELLKRLVFCGVALVLHKQHFLEARVGTRVESWVESWVEQKARPNSQHKSRVYFRTKLMKIWQTSDWYNTWKNQFEP